jgi:putative acetyltransferase
LTVRPETEADSVAIRELVTEVFRSDAEARLVERLRNEGHILVSLIVADDQRIVGNVVFSHVPIFTEGRTIEAAALAPMAVHRDYQHLGIGSALVNEGLRICKQRGKDAVIVLGDPRYYTRFGFSSELAAGIRSKYSGTSFMAIELTPQVLRRTKGTAAYPSAFDDLGQSGG